MPTLAHSLRESAAVVANLEGTAGYFAALDAVHLMAASRSIAELRRHVDQFAALAAGEVAHRSRRELGAQGLAQKAGFVSPVAMIQKEAQVSKHEATRLIEMGTLLADVEHSTQLLEAASGAVGPEPGTEPGTDAGTEPGGTGPSTDASSSAANRLAGLLAPEWHGLLAAAVGEGRMSLDKVDSIRRVMADVVDVDDTAITAVVADLISTASHSNPEQLYRAAKRARDVIDADGIARREKQQRDLRTVRTWWDTNGMHCGSWRLAPEDGALVAEAFAQILSPRRGGPRFVEAGARATAEELLNDPRTDEQIAADAFTQMMRLAVDADPGTLFGTRRPAVRVVVTADRLGPPDPLNTPTGHGTPAGHGNLEGRHDAVSAATIDRHICDTGVISIKFDDDGQCVNVGRDHRLFTHRQRIGLAIRDGGCRFPECERPPSYSEAHHINPWKAKHGKTNIADGILLCRRHHLLIHNNNWNVQRDGADYYLQPPTDIDPTQEPIPIPSRSPIHDEIRRERQPA